VECAKTLKEFPFTIEIERAYPPAIEKYGNFGENVPAPYSKLLEGIIELIR